MSKPVFSAKYTMFASLSKGGYMRVFESTSHPGIHGVIKRETRKHNEVKQFFLNDTEYKTVKDVLEAYEASKGVSNET